MNNLTVEQIEEHLSNLAIDVSEGVADPMDVYAFLSRVEKAAEPLKKAVKESAMEKALEYNADKEKVSYRGHSFRIQKGRSMYSFKHIDTWKKLEEEKKRVEELAKFAAKNNASVVDEETGEFIDPAHVTFAADSLIVTVDK